jgi:DNA-directed RNA polymerase specialized sigma24 family protein
MDETLAGDIDEVGLTAQPADFESFYRTAWNRTYRALAVTLDDPDLAREAVDEAMVRAYRSWRKVRRYENQTGWVYRVALNWAISQLRKRRRLVFGRRPVEVGLPDRYSSPDLYEALHRLDIKHRSVVVLRHLLDWSEAEIAAALRIPQGTVKSRLSRALAKLRKEMS